MTEKRSSLSNSIGAQLVRLSTCMVTLALAVLALAATAHWAIRRDLDRQHRLLHDLATTQALAQTVDRLRISAGSAIIHRQHGIIPEEVRKIAHTSGEAALIEIGRLQREDTESWLAEAARVIRDEFPALRALIEKDLFTLIEGAAQRAEETEDAFGVSDDRIDTLCVGLQARIEQARSILEADSEYELQRLSSDVYRLNLVAMDIIVDRNAGISPERQRELTEATTALRTSMSKIGDALVASGKAADLAAAMADEMTRVIDASARELPALVVRHVAEVASVGDGFRTLGYQLDEVGERASSQIAAIQQRLTEEQTTATAQVISTINRYGAAIIFAAGIALIALISGVVVFYRRITRSLNVTLAKIHDTVVGLAAAATQFTSGAQRLASGTDNQSAAIQEISSTMDEVSATARSNAETARQSEAATGEADRAAAGVGQSVERLGVTMGVIREAATESVGVVLAIDEIAFQTKILAVNAAIEAARLGRASNSGFSVLSEEIRSLAQQSVEAARRTGDRLRESQDRSQAGEEVVREVAAAIAQVLASVQTASRQSIAVAHASNEQVRGVEQVNQSIAELNRTVQANATDAEETLATSAGLRDQASMLANQVAELKRLIG